MLALSLYRPIFPARTLRRLRDWCLRAAERQRQRRELALLTEEALSDIGLTRAAAAAESRKPFWRR